MNATNGEPPKPNVRSPRKPWPWGRIALVVLVLTSLFFAWRAWSFARQRDRVLTLLQDLDNPEWKVQSAASKELEQMGVGALPHFSTALSHPEKSVRRHAARRLGGLGLQDTTVLDKALDLLLPALRDSDDDIRAFATRYFYEHTPLHRTIRERLVAILEEQNPDARAAASAVLGRNGASSLPEMRELFRNGRLGTRLSACHVIGQFHGSADPAIPELRAALQDREALVRLAAAEALSLQGHHAQEAIPDLIELTRDRVDEVRGGAALALGRFGFSAIAAYPRLIELLSDPVVEVQHSAALALGGLGLAGYASHPHLVVAMGGESEVRQAIREAIARVLPHSTPEMVAARQKVVESISKELEQDILALRLPPDERDSLRQSFRVLASTEEEPRVVALVSLMKSGATAVPLLRKLLATQSDLIVRGSVIIALGAIGPAAVDAIPDLLPLLGDENPTIAWRAARSLGSMGRAAVPGLVRVLDTGSDRARTCAVNALGVSKQEAREAGPVLVKALADPNENVRRNAAWALGCIGYREALPDLLKLLDSDDEVMWRSVAGAIAMMKPLDDAVFRRLLKGLRSERPLVRLETIRVLGWLGPAAIEALADLDKISVEDDIADCRWAARDARLKIQAH